MSHTHVDDVATELGRPIPEGPEHDQIESWIRRVEGRILRRIPDLADRVLDEDYLETVRSVVAAVVARKVLNPEGFRSERVDDYYYDRGSQKADLWPSQDEWADLLPGAASGAFSVRPTFEPDRVWSC